MGQSLVRLFCGLFNPFIFGPTKPALETPQLYSRIAPTPSGYLHLGNAFNFLLTDYLVRREGGQLRLRIDDLDAPRVRPEYVADIFETLHRLGIQWQQGPRDAAGQQQRYTQQLRLPRYHNLIEQLINTGNVFACTCSRKELQQNSMDGQYPGTCRYKGLPLDTPDAALRIVTPEGSRITFQDAIAGSVETDLYRHNRDFIIRRRDGIPAYHVGSLCDDVDYGINLIVRGADLLESTAAQLYLATILGEDAFKQVPFYHHPLLMDNGGEKLSKSAGSTSLKHLWEQGESSATIRQRFAAWKATFLPI